MYKRVKIQKEVIIIEPKGKNLSAVLKQEQENRNMTLREFGKELGISHTYLFKLKKGINIKTGKPIKPTIDILIKISDKLNIKLDNFLKLCGYY